MAANKKNAIVNSLITFVIAAYTTTCCILKANDVQSIEFASITVLINYILIGCGIALIIAIVCLTITLLKQ